MRKGLIHQCSSPGESGVSVGYARSGVSDLADVDGLEDSASV